jgi:hypothetical protein
MKTRRWLWVTALVWGCVGSTSGGDPGAPDGGRDGGPEPVDAGVPYALPGPGGVVTVGTNTASDVAGVFPGYTADWLSLALFGSFGSGTYVRDYSPQGAYVLTAMGGHASPPQLTGAVLFDFHDATWKAFENANGVPSLLGGTEAAAALSNGDPWQEFSGSEVPLPSHPYLIPAELPTALGGGPQGSVLLVSRAALTASGGGGRGPHALDLATHRWRRLSSADEPRIAGIESSVIFDADAGRYYGVPGDLTVRKDIPYYDVTDWGSVHTSLPQYGWPAATGSSAFLDPARRLILVLHGQGLLAFQLDDPGQGWQPLTVTGTMPEPTAEVARWAWFPPDDRFYFRPMTDGGATLHRLTPPADALHGTWVADTVALDAPMPDCDAVAMNGSWYGFLFYVPPLHALAWIVGAKQPVYLFVPPR